MAGAKVASRPSRGGADRNYRGRLASRPARSSPLTRGRGSKLLQACEGAKQSLGAPHAGARIETRGMRHNPPTPRRRPSRGGADRNSAALVGGPIGVRPSRGGADRNNGIFQYVTAWLMSPLTRGRGSKRRKCGALSGGAARPSRGGADRNG